MRDNPEWQRQLWLELTPPRLVVGPLLLAILFFATWKADGQAMGEATATMGMWLFFTVTALWGSLQAGNALLREVQQKTWDGQRLSAMTPATLFLGKLLGSTVYAWLLGLPCLLAYTLGLAGMLEGKGGDTSRLLVQPLLLMGAGFSCQILILIASLISLPRLRHDATRLISGVTAIPVVMFVVWVVIPMSILLTPVQVKCGEGCGEALWFHIPFQLNELALFSLALFLPWLLLAGWRLLSNELQYRRSPWIWLSFCVFLTVYIAGLEMNSLPALPTGIFLVLFGLVYLTVLVEEKDLLLYLRLQRLLEEGRWKAFLSLAPVWLLTLGYLFLLVLLSLVTPLPDGPERPAALVRLLLTTAGRDLPLLPILFAYLVRDVAVVVLIATMERVKRHEAAALLILFSLYVVVPWPFAQAEMEWVVMLFRPSEAYPGHLAALMAPALEALIIMGLLKPRLQRVQV